MAISGPILITGGTGYLGSYLARHMLNEKGEKDIVLFDIYPDIRVRGIDRVEGIRDKVTIVQGDVGDPTEVFRVIKKYDIKRIVHLAFSMGAWAGGDAPRWMRINGTGTTNIFEAALLTGVKRVVYASSARVYGSELPEMYNEPLTEDDPPTPTVGSWENVYGACKLMMEMLADVYWQQHGLDVVGMRPTATFGLAKNRAEVPNDMEIPSRLEVAAMGREVSLAPDDQVVDFMYAADAAEAWYLASTVENPRPSGVQHDLRGPVHGRDQRVHAEDSPRRQVHRRQRAPGPPPTDEQREDAYRPGLQAQVHGGAGPPRGPLVGAGRRGDVAPSATVNGPAGVIGEAEIARWEDVLPPLAGGN